MLRKMILQGLVAAVLIGGAAAAYAQMTGAPVLAHDDDRGHDRDDD